MEELEEILNKIIIVSGLWTANKPEHVCTKHQVYYCMLAGYATTGLLHWIDERVNNTNIVTHPTPYA